MSDQKYLCSSLPLQVDSQLIYQDSKNIFSHYQYDRTMANIMKDKISLSTEKTDFIFKIFKKKPKLGLMLVGLGGNNGSTFIAGTLANKYKISWNTKDGINNPNWLGSITQSSTIRVGNTMNFQEVFIPLKSMLPMIDPDEICISGWDINSADMNEAMKRAKVIDYDMSKKLKSFMEKIKPLKSIYYPDFIATNQSERANNTLPGNKPSIEHLNMIRNDIKKFKKENNLDKIIVLWTANTERFVKLKKGVHDTEENIIKGIKNGDEEISPSQMFAMASLLEGCSYINGSPQNTFVPGIIKCAERQNLFLVGDDFKSGQTKIKSLFIDFLVSAGIKPNSIVSYNHLGNNDGKNLSSRNQFKSKEITKSNVILDVIKSNNIIFGNDTQPPNHKIVIEYVPFVNDSKRAMDEYISSIFLNGKHTFISHNTCEDSLLAAPIILDLVILTEIHERIEYAILNDTQLNQVKINMESAIGFKYSKMDTMLSVLSYLLKNPQVKKNTPVVNVLYKQRCCIENLLRAYIGLKPDNNMLLESKI